MLCAGALEATEGCRCPARHGTEPQPARRSPDECRVGRASLAVELPCHTSADCVPASRRLWSLSRAGPNGSAATTSNADIEKALLVACRSCWMQHHDDLPSTVWPPRPIFRPSGPGKPGPRSKAIANAPALPALQIASWQPRLAVTQAPGPVPAASTVRRCFRKWHSGPSGSCNLPSCSPPVPSHLHRPVGSSMTRLSSSRWQYLILLVPPSDLHNRPATEMIASTGRTEAALKRARPAGDRWHTPPVDRRWTAFLSQRHELLSPFPPACKGETVVMDGAKKVRGRARTPSTLVHHGILQSTLLPRSRALCSWRRAAHGRSLRLNVETARGVRSSNATQRGSPALCPPLASSHLRALSLATSAPCSSCFSCIAVESVAFAKAWKHHMGAGSNFVSLRSALTASVRSKKKVVLSSAPARRQQIFARANHGAASAMTSPLWHPGRPHDALQLPGIQLRCSRIRSPHPNPTMRR